MAAAIAKKGRTRVGKFHLELKSPSEGLLSASHMSDGYRVRCDLLNIEGDTQANAASSTALTKTAYEDIEAIATSEGIYLGTPSVGASAS